MNNILLTALVVALIGCAIVWATMYFCSDPFVATTATVRKDPQDRVVCSLTTIPSRIEHIRGVVEDLLGLDVKPDAVYVNVPHWSHRDQAEYTIPGWLEELAGTEPRLIVNRCDDVGPLTKIYPTLLHETDSDTILFLCDDDQRYPPGAFNELFATTKADPTTAFAYRGIVLENYKDLRFIENDDKEVDYLETYAGVVYRVRFLEGLEPLSNDNPCWFCDDLTISERLRRNGVPRRTICGSEYGQGGSASDPIEHNNAVSAIAPLYEENGVGRNQACIDELLRQR